MPTTLVPAAQCTPPGLVDIARSTTIGTGAAPSLWTITPKRRPGDQDEQVEEGPGRAFRQYQLRAGCVTPSEAALLFRLEVDSVRVFARESPPAR